MLAATYRALGPSDVLIVADVVRPEPGPGEVRVRLRVAGVNPTDWKMRSGAPLSRAFQIPGQDGAGEIDAVGEGVAQARIGERVWVWFAAARGRQWGSAAQWTVVPARQAVLLPDAVSYDHGAGLGIPAMTAWHCLFADGPLDGCDVLVAGGAGAVGNVAIALARRAGARVVATTSGPAKTELALAAGAHAVVNYRLPDAADQVRAIVPDGVQRIIEVALGANLALDLAVAAPRAVVSTYADDDLHTSTRPLMVANLTLAFVLIYGLADEALDQAVAGVSAAVAAGDLPALPVTRFALSDIAAAHDAVQAGTIGKVLIDLP